MTDNFSNMATYLINEGKINQSDPKNLSDTYYVVELMRRGKDNPDLSAANVHFKNYYINCISDLFKYKEEIIKLCETLNMRAYISVNYKSYKQVALDTMAELARRISVHEIKRPYAIYESCSGKYIANSNHRWVIDVDREDWMTDEEFEKYCKMVRTAINNCRSDHDGPNVIWDNPTKTGWHFITTGFKRNEGVGGESEDNFPRQMQLVITELLGNRIKFYDDAWEDGWFDSRLVRNPGEDMIHENHITLLYENIK